MKTKTSKLTQIKAFFIRIVRRSYLLKQANDRLNDQEFYEKMQWYRFVHTTNQGKLQKPLKVLSNGLGIITLNGIAVWLVGEYEPKTYRIVVNFKTRENDE